MSAVESAREQLRHLALPGELTVKGGTSPILLGGELRKPS
jgi:hypothetical protein